MSKLTLSFRILKNGQLIRMEKLTQNVIKIGKVPSAHLQLDDESVSRMHAIIEVLGDNVSLIDLGSTRGTFVNGQRINKAKLQSGDSISIGDATIELSIAAAELAASPMVIVTPPAPPPAPALRVVPPAAVTMFVAPTVATPAPAPVALPAAPIIYMAPEAEVPGARAPEVGTDDERGRVRERAPEVGTDDERGRVRERAVEVATMLGDSVVSVKHCMDPNSGKVTRKTWAFFAAGLACLLGSAIAFKVSVDAAAMNKAALDYHTRVRKLPAFSFRPVATTTAGLDFLAFGGLALGLLGMTAGLVRMRNEKKSPHFRIGTAPGVEQPLETAPSADFPLVAPAGDDFVFNYGAGMEGELIVDGVATPLSELAATGRARPSATTAGAIEVPIPYAARIRARSGNTTFLVSSVAKPKTQPVALFGPTSNRTMAYVAGSLAVHMGVWAFLQTIPMDDSGVNIDLASQETTDLRGATTEKDTIPPPEETDLTPGDSGNKDGSGATMALPEGQSGKPDAKSVDGHVAIKDNKKEPSLTREQAIEIVRTQGWFGETSALQGGIHSLASQADFSSGFDDANIYGPLFGAAGEGQGNFGGGRSGWDVGGGCSLPPCGIIGAGRYGTIGNGDKVGQGWGEPGSGGGSMRRHVSQVPGPTIGDPRVGGGLDKDIIRRYIKRNVAKLGYCYEKQLLANPMLSGTVSTQFLIAADGTVMSSSGSGVSDEVAGCVAGVIKTIKFPAPKDGGTVAVTYPFHFHQAGN